MSIGGLVKSAAQALAATADVRRAQAAKMRAEAGAAEVGAEARRSHLRRVEELADRVLDRSTNLGDYFSARNSNLRAGNRPRGGAGDYHLDGRTRQLLANDGASLRRNNVPARAMVQRLADMVVYDGWTFTSNTGDKVLDSTIEQAVWSFEKFGCDVRKRRTASQLEKQALRSAAFHGDVLIGIRPNGKMQLVLGERVANPGNPLGTDDEQPPTVGDTNGKDSPPWPSTGTVRQGVHLDADGAAMGYYVHPWDSTSTSLAPKWTFCPAADLEKMTPGWILFSIPLHEDAELTRGEPLVQAVVRRLLLLEEYKDDVQLAATIATLFGLVTKTDNPGDTRDSLGGADDEDPDGEGPAGQLASRLDPAGILHLRPGESAEQIDPKQPTQLADAWVKLITGECCADIGLSPQLLRLDASDSNFHGMMSALAMTFRGVVAEMHESFLPVITLRTVVRLRYEKASGAIREIRDPRLFTMTPPAGVVVDPEKQTNAAVTQIDNNLRTKDDAIQELGYARGFRDVAPRRKAEVDAEREAGITPPSMPGAKTAAEQTGGDRGKAKPDKETSDPET